jgi:hypothetical protein
LTWEKLGPSRALNGPYRIDKVTLEKMLPDEERFARDMAKYQIALAKWYKENGGDKKKKPPKKPTMKYIIVRMSQYAGYYEGMPRRSFDPIAAAPSKRLIIEALRKHQDSRT